MGEIESAFRDLKTDLAIHPIFHQREDRIESHIFVVFPSPTAYRLLSRHMRWGPIVRQALEKLSAMQLLDVYFPTTDGRELVFTRYTEPEADQQLLLTSWAGSCHPRHHRRSRPQKQRRRCSTDLAPPTFGTKGLRSSRPSSSEVKVPQSVRLKRN